MKTDDLAGTPAQYFKAIEEAEPMPLRGEPANNAGESHTPAQPRPLPPEKLPVPDWEETLLPESLRPWLADVCDRMQAPPEYAAVSAVVALGSLIGRQVAVYPKRLDNWSVIPHPWGAVVGPPGALKSPAMREPMKLMNRLDEVARCDHEAAKLKFVARHAVAAARKVALQDAMKKAVRENNDALLDQLATQLAELAEPEAPRERRLVVNDATPEKLGELLRDNPNGLLVCRDELSGWLKLLERDGHEGERAFFLEAWDGHGAYTFDRIARGKIRIDPACVTMLGGIQPGPLRQHIRAAIRGGAGDDGLLPRFQLLVYPDVSREFRNVDRGGDHAALEAVMEVFRACMDLHPASIGALPEQLGPPSLHFSDEAQDLSDEYRINLEHRLRAGREAPVMAAHLGKYRSLLPALAGIFHIADVVAGMAAPGPISADAARLALRWMTFLEAHARRVYGLALSGEVSIALAIREKLLDGKLPGTFTVRDIYVQGWVGLTEPEEVENGLSMLVNFGWLESYELKGRGRPTTYYTWNPARVELAPTGTGGR